MNRILFLFLIFLSACAVPPTQEHTSVPKPVQDTAKSKGIPYGAKMVLKGYYTGKNIYVQNPYSDAGGYCVALAPVVNGDVTTRLIKSSAFEIDLEPYHFKIGDPVEIVITHDSGCEPKILNPEALSQVPLQKDQRPAFYDSLKDWEAFWQRKFKPFSLDKFYAAAVSRITNDEEYNWLSTFPEARQVTTNFFSPDSELIADIYTYRWSLGVENHQLVLEGGEPESQVELTDVKRKRTCDIIGCGTPCYFEDLIWLGPKEFVLVGHETADWDKPLYQGFIYHVDLVTKEITSYLSRNYHFIDPKDYIKFRVSQLLGVEVH